jgi:hypothetical protein
MSETFVSIVNLRRDGPADEKVAELHAAAFAKRAGAQGKRVAPQSIATGTNEGGRWSSCTAAEQDGDALSMDALKAAVLALME